MSIFGLATAQAQSARTAAFQVSVTYQNVDVGPATVNFNFYAQNSGTAIPNPAITLNEGAGASLLVGSVSGISAGFKGSGVISSDKRVVAVIVQFSTTAGVKNRPLSAGFSSTDAASTVLVATVL